MTESIHPHSPCIIDVEGVSLCADDRRRLCHPMTGGVILFSRNWRDRAHLLELICEIKALRGDLLVCVDHEGGRVQRFRSDGFTLLPPMRAFGQRWMLDKNGQAASGAMQAASAATAAGYVLGSELRACAVDFSFAPVLDLDWQRSAVIGDRAFHSDARVVTLLAKSLMHGLLQTGMANCGKHFPGHGFTVADSHTDIPVDERPLNEILASDAMPYAWLGSCLNSVMPAHIVYPAVDSKPAGFSSRWLQDILRERLGFTGAIFSDDLGMAGAAVIDGHHVTHTQAALVALRAGCDMVLLCNQSQRGNPAIDNLLDGLLNAQGRDHWQPDAASESRRLALLPQTPPIAWDELAWHAPYLHAQELLQELAETVSW